jgi:hypothetical protein
MTMPTRNVVSLSSCLSTGAAEGVAGAHAHSMECGSMDSTMTTLLLQLLIDKLVPAVRFKNATATVLTLCYPLKNRHPKVLFQQGNYLMKHDANYFVAAVCLLSFLPCCRCCLCHHSRLVSSVRGITAKRIIVLVNLVHFGRIAVVADVAVSEYDSILVACPISPNVGLLVSTSTVAAGSSGSIM